MHDQPTTRKPSALAGVLLVLLWVVGMAGAEDLYEESGSNFGEPVAPKSLKEWTRLATTGRAQATQLTAARTILNIAQRSNRLEEPEFNECRRSALALLASKNAEVRATGVEALGYVGDDSCIKPVLKLINDRDADVQMNVVLTLGSIGDDTCVGPIAALAPRSKCGARICFQSLAQIGTPAAKTALEKMEKRIKDELLLEDVREAIDAIDSK